MNPENIPFNALIVGPTTPGKTRYLVNLLRNKFRFKLDCIILLCPTYIHNDTYRAFATKDGGFPVLSPAQDRIDDYLKLVSCL